MIANKILFLGAVSLVAGAIGRMAWSMVMRGLKDPITLQS